MILLLLQTASAGVDWSCPDAAGTVDLTADLTGALSADPTATLLAPVRIDGAACALSAGAEVTVRADLLDPHPGLSLDRVWAGLTGTMQLRLGRISSPSSDVTRTARQGQWAEPTPARPMYAREDGGLLLTHGDGAILESLGALDVAVMLSRNDDGGTLAERVPQIIGEGTVFPVHQPLATDSSLEGGERVRLDAALGLRRPALHLGIGGHVHRLAADATMLEDAWAEEWTQQVLTGHVRGRRGRVSAQGEVVGIWSRGDGQTTASQVGFAQVSVDVGPLTPWVRLDMKRMAEQDAYYTPMGRDLDAWQVEPGLRWSIRDDLAVKLAGALGRAESRDDLGRLGEAPVRALSLQVTGRL